jgi:hypothetical protein
MKKQITILLFWLIGIAALGASITLVWDANDPTEQVTGYNLYEKSGTNWVKVATTTNTTHTLDVQPGVHVFVVTATNFWGESPFSSTAETPKTNQAPGGVKVKR